MAKDHGRILLMFDRDFSEIRYRSADDPGIVIVRLKDMPVDDAADRVAEVLSRLTQEGMSRNLVIIAARNVRTPRLRGVV